MTNSLLLSTPLSSFLRRPRSRLTHLFPTKPSSLLSSSISAKPLYSSNPSKFLIRTSTKDANTYVSEQEDDKGLVGEDSAAFDLGEQKISSWIYFSVILGVVLFVLQVAWIDNSTGFGKVFIDYVSTLSESHEVFLLIRIFKLRVYSLIVLFGSNFSILEEKPQMSHCIFIF